MSKDKTFGLRYFNKGGTFVDDFAPKKKFKIDTTGVIYLAGSVIVIFFFVIYIKFVDSEDVDPVANFEMEMETLYRQAEIQFRAGQCELLLQILDDIHATLDEYKNTRYMEMKCKEMLLNSEVAEGAEP